MRAIPNWCQCRLTVSGPVGDRERFRRELHATHTYPEDDTLVPEAKRGQQYTVELDFAATVPEPPEGDPRRLPSDSHQGSWDWYSWRVANWGTKWQPSTIELAESPDALSYSFDTAWAPPVEWVRRTSIAYPALALELAWIEFGMEFYGRARFSDGEQLRHDEGDFGEAVSWDDDADEPTVSDPLLRAFIDEHSFGTYS